MKPPRISVLMTVYNAGPYLNAAIDGIVRQSFRDLEFIIVDDGSQDGSREIIQHWAKRDARIVAVLNETNSGQTRCLNHGLKLARGQWIARQDADDISLPLRLENQLRTAKKVRGCALVGTCGWIIREDGGPAGLLDVPLSETGIRWTSPFLNPFVHTAVMFSTSVARDEFGGYDETYAIAQDYDLWTRMSATHPSANVGRRLVCYRHLQSSLSKAGRGRAQDEARRVSVREAARVFGGQLSKPEQALVDGFREGLHPSQRRDFWRLYHEKLRAFRQAFPKWTDAGRTIALHHLWAAGSLEAQGARRAAIGEMRTAFFTSPLTVLSWLTDRYFRSGAFRTGHNRPS